jgi:hypothetical protein
MMRKLIATIMLIFLAYTPVSAQLVEAVFGPLVGDSAGILYADMNQTIDLDLWLRTAPGISIVALHNPLSSKDEYIPNDSREGGELCDKLQSWDDAAFLIPNPDPEHSGYTSQSLIGVCALMGFCEDDESIDTDGEWWWIASFTMTTVAGGATGVPLCDAFIEGYHPDFHNMVFVDVFAGEIDPSDVELDFACLWINEVACSEYTMGDYNGSGAFNVADIVDSYSKLKTGLPQPASICECPPESGDFWAVAADVNNSCAFNVADIVDGYSFLKTGSPEPEPCWMCPPGEP